MKKSLFLLLMTSLVLAACQNDKAPAAKVPAEPAAVASTSVSVENAKKAVSPAQQKQAAASADNAVAVSKPPETHTAQNLNAAMQKTGNELKAQLESMQPAVSTKLKAAKQVSPNMSGDQSAAIKPAAVKTIVAKSVPTVSASAVPAQKHTVAKKAVTRAKAVIAPPPVVATTSTELAGNASKGKSLAKKCAACHNFTAKKKLGPGLKGVVGRKAGIMPDMKYSAALAAGGWVWTAKNIAMWDCNSKKAIKVLSGNPAARTKMPPQRICDPQKQADLIAFLKTL